MNKVILIARRVIQIASFILMPGLFAQTFSALGSIFTALFSGGFSWSVISPSFWILMITVPATILLGRFFCGFFCSFGAMGDFLWFMSRKLRLPRLKLSSKLDSGFKYIKYGILVFCAAFLWTGLLSIPDTASPWNIFGMYTSIGNWPGLSYMISIGGALLILIMALSMFVERAFCRYLCPLGAVYAPVSRPRLFRIIKRRARCGSCTACTSRCSMGIPLYSVDKVRSGECINCLACVNVCPTSNAKADPNPAVAAAMSAAVISGLYFVDTVALPAMNDTSYTQTQQQTAGDTETSATNKIIPSGIYANGTYTGSGMGFRGEINGTVTVENGYITDITVTSYQDDVPYFERAESTVISDIIDSQDIDVSVVSGATYSSNGIIEAVADALGLEFTNPNASGIDKRHGEPM